eukprot:2557798-Rhodomonas_salina.1
MSGMHVAYAATHFLPHFRGTAPSYGRRPIVLRARYAMSDAAITCIFLVLTTGMAGPGSTTELRKAPFSQLLPRVFRHAGRAVTQLPRSVLRDVRQCARAWCYAEAASRKGGRESKSQGGREGGREVAYVILRDTSASEYLTALDTLA